MDQIQLRFAEKRIRNYMIDAFVTSFHRCFIEGNRYMMIVDGLKTTLIISIGAGIIGIVLGMLLAILRISGQRKDYKFAFHRFLAKFFSGIAGIYIDIIRGTPTVVQLMIISILVFKSQLGVMAGVVAFGLNSAAYVSENIRAGILSINKGQMEAGRSLGLSYGLTMRHIIIPQAVKNILPALGNEFIVLVKETAVVGMIGVADLMKSSNYIISRVYEAAMPLFAVALIYYILLKLLATVLNAFERRLRKSDIR